jgi:outer membrane protein, heavy metal efflux system
MNHRFGIILLCLLAGCARFKNEPISASRTADALEGRTLDNPALRSFLETNLHRAFTNWPKQSWDFETLTLAAFYYHPSLDVARAQWMVAQGGNKTAAGRLNPNVSFTPAYNNQVADAPSPWIFPVTFDIPIETAGKRRRRMEQAASLSEAARLNIASAAWQVRSGVKRHLLDLNAALETQVLLQDQQKLQAESLRLLEGQHQAGAVSAFEVAQAAIAVDSARLALRDAERQTAEARVQLAAAIGVPASALNSVTLSYEGLEVIPSDASLAEARRQALLNRSDILSALAEYAASQSALQLEIARQFPDLHLGPGYSWNSGSEGDNQWELGLTMELPVLNQNQGPIAEATARRRELAARFVALQAGVLSDIELALAGYRAAMQKRADTEDLRERLQKQQQRSQAMFELGEISRGDLVALQLQLSTAAQARLDAITKSQQALAQLEDALQGPLGLPEPVWQTSPRSLETTQANTQP